MKGPAIKHPDWLRDHNDLEGSLRLWRTGVIPKSIEGFMVVTPIRHALRCVYGSDFRAVIALAGLAIRSWWGLNVNGRIYQHLQPRWMRDAIAEADKCEGDECS